MHYLRLQRVMTAKSPIKPKLWMYQSRSPSRRSHTCHHMFPIPAACIVVRTIRTFGILSTRTKSSSVPYKSKWLGSWRKACIADEAQRLIGSSWWSTLLRRSKLSSVGSRMWLLATTNKFSPGCCTTESKPNDSWSFAEKSSENSSKRLFELECREFFPDWEWQTIHFDSRNSNRNWMLITMQHQGQLEYSSNVIFSLCCIKFQSMKATSVFVTKITRHAAKMHISKRNVTTRFHSYSFYGTPSTIRTTSL